MAMKNMVNLRDYLATEHSVGDWQGQEKLVADNVNRLYQAVYGAAPAAINEYSLRNVLWDLWDEWGSDDSGLLSLTEEQITTYVATIF
jgi:hypothetical protein